MMLACLRRQNAPVVRSIFGLALTAVAWHAVAAALFAADGDAWPILDEANRSRGPGFYLSVWKIALAWVVFLLWVRTTDWLSRDCHEHKMSTTVWNSIVVGSFLVAMILLWVVPSFWIGFPVLVFAYIGPLVVYAVQRNALVMDDEKILTGRHFKSLLAGGLRPMGVKVQVDKADPRESGPPITIIPGGLGSERDERANLLRARQSVGFPPVRRMLGEALAYRADMIALDLLPQNTEIRLQVDGVWHPFPPEDVATGAAMLDVLKLISGLDLDEHATKQTGRCAVDVQNRQYPCEVVAEMVKTGERAIVRFEVERQPFESLADLGMRDKSQQAVKDALSRKQGLVLFSSLPKQGLTTSINVAVGTSDRLMREVYSIEPVNRREKEIENVTVVTFDPAAKQTPAHLLPALLRKYPDALIVRDWADADSVNQLCQLAAEDKLVVGSLMAKDAIEALLRVLMLKAQPQAFAKALTMSVSMRLLRKLCEACKQAYVPTAEELKPFGIPEGRVAQLYRVPVPDPTKKKRDQQICPKCEGIGYVGRTAVFEVLPIDDELRRVLVEQPKMETLRAAARKAKVRSLIEEAVLLAASGATSLDEVTRVFSGK